ncbi:MAG: choice-of-anchor V domain-containing protein [Bacteroidia bacterium]
MKFKILIAFVLLLAGAILVDSGQKAFSNAGGAPAGTTGSPADGNSCAASGCHTGTPVTKKPGWITSNIPAAGYTPGHTYQIAAKAIYIGRSKFGFEVSPQDMSGTIIGTLVNTTGQTQIRTPGYITQTSTGNTATDSLTWTFNWTAPAAGTGGFTFYGAFNCANGNGGTSGDIIYTSTLAIGEAPSPGVDAGILAILNPDLYTCSASVTPVVRIHNFGTTTLTSATINYKVDAGTPSTQAWTGSLMTDSSMLVTLPVTAVTSGRHTFSAYTSNPNSVADTIPSNDGKTVTFDVKSSPASTPFAEGFDTTWFPKSNWEISNPNNDTTWRRVTTSYHSAPACVFIDNYLYKKPGAIDELITPTFNLSAITTPVLTFQLAYQLYTNPASSPNASDTLEVYISTDCGTTWTQLYKKYGVPLTTATPAFSTAAFHPTAAQWRFEFINLAAYASASSAMFKFVNITDYENNLYLDDVHIDNSMGIQNRELNPLSLSLFPNPATDQLQVNYELTEAAPLAVRIYDMQGMEMPLSLTEAKKSAGKYSAVFDLRNIPAGTYLLHFTAGSASETKRFSVLK